MPRAARLPLANDNTGGPTGWCLEVHDLAVSKLVAGREKDLDFLRVLVRERVVNPTSPGMPPVAARPSVKRGECPRSERPMSRDLLAPLVRLT